MLGKSALSAIHTMGMDILITQVRGTVCPCMSFVDSLRPEYSAEYHRLYPLAADCGGSGVVNTTSTVIPARAVVYPLSIAYQVLSRKTDGWIQEVIGRLKECDMVLAGTIQTADMTFYDLTALSEKSDKITFNSVDYRISNIASYQFAGEMMFQVAGLKRMT